LGQQRLNLELQRDTVRATVVQAWGLLEAAKAQIQAAQVQVNAAEIALNGVREEARVGQRTTLDVLNAQQELVNARVALVTAQRDRVVNSYNLLASTGYLSAGAWARDRALRPADSLSSDSRRLARRSNTGWPIASMSERRTSVPGRRPQPGGN
jgi:outer membrane protein TolC